MIIENSLPNDKITTPFLIFMFIYFGMQIGSQIWGKYVDKGGIPAYNNYIQNFVSAIVLIGLVIYFARPTFLLNRYSSVFFILTFVFALIYAFLKKGLDDMNEKDKKLGRGTLMKSLTVMMLFLYGGIAFAYFVVYMKRADSKSFLFKHLGVSVLLIALITSFYVFKVNKYDQDNITISLFLYPILFLTRGIEDSKFLSYTYIIIYTTVVALWGFFGVEWFTGKKYDEVNNKTCKAYLGISDEQLSTPYGPQTQTKINTTNINFIFLAMGMIFLTFIVALIFVFITIQKMSG